MVIPRRHLQRYGNDRQLYSNLITKMCDSYHNSSIALLQHQISYRQRAQYLKRFYQENQFANKIQMLSDYYKYHRQIPRLFHQDLHSIIQNYHEDWRTLQYKFVSKRMKEAQNDQLALTNREKTNRAVEKVLKNIQLSYYNFQNKNDKKVKGNENHNKNKQSLLSRNKKSMPLLPLYQFQKQKDVQQKSKIHAIKVLGIKDTNRNIKKSKQKHTSKKISVNNSFQQPKNLSRTKSKSNLVTAFALQHQRKNSAKASQNEVVPRGDKMKSAQVSLQKTQSTKNILERKKSQIKTKVIKLDQRKQQGVKYMFKRLSQARNTIKIGR